MAVSTFAQMRIGTVGLLMGLVMACGGAPADTSIPLDEVRRLNNQLSTSYVRTTDLLAQASQASVTAGMIPPEYNPQDFDVAMVREVLAACFTQSVATVPGTQDTEVPRAAIAEPGEDRGPLTRRAAVGRVRACNPPRLLALETYLQVVDPALRTFLLQRTLDVDALRANLGDVIPANLDALERQGTEATAEAARLRALVESRRSAGAAAAGSEDSAASEEQRYHQALDELDQIDALLLQLGTEVRQLRQMRRQLVDDTVRSISAMGTTN